MAAPDDPVARRIASLDDEDLIRMAEAIEQNPGDYTEHAVALATAEISRRGGLERIHARTQGVAREPSDSQPSKTIRRSAVLGFAFAVLFGALALGVFGVTPAYSWASAVISLLFVLGSVLALTGHYSGARVCMLIGGILGLPLGVFMIAAANRIHDAARELLRAQGRAAGRGLAERAGGGPQP